MAKKKTDSPVSYRSIMSGGRSLFESNDNDFGYKKDQSPIINTKEYVDSQNSINEYRDRMQKERDARKQAIELAKWEQSNKVHAVTDNNVTLSMDQAINRAKERTANYSEDQIKAADEFNKNTKTGANAVQRRYVLGSMGEKVGLSADEFEQLAEYRRYITGQESADTKAEEAKQKVKDHPFLGAIGETIDANLKGYVTAADTTKETLKKYSGAYKDSELPINTYTRGAEDARVSAKVAQQVKENIDNSVSNPILNKAINFGYDLFNSGVTNVANNITSKAVGLSLGMEAIGEAYGYLKFFNSGYQQGIIDSQTRGLTENQAIAMGIANGAAEVIGELIPFHTMQTALGKGAKRLITKEVFLKAIGSTRLSEFLGEGFTTLANQLADTYIAKDKSEKNMLKQYYMSAEGGSYSEAEAEFKAEKQQALDVIYDASLGWASAGAGQFMARGGYNVGTTISGMSMSKDTKGLSDILYNPNSKNYISEDRIDYSSDADYEKALDARSKALKALNDTRGNKKASIKDAYNLSESVKSAVIDAQSNRSDVPNEFKTAKQDLDTALKSINEANTPYQLAKAMESLKAENNSTKKAYKNAIIRLENAGFTADDVQKTHTAASIFTQTLKGEALDESVLDSIPETDRAVAKEALKRGTNLYTIRNNTASAIVSSTGDAIAIDLDKGTVKDSNGNVSIYDKEGNTHSIDSLESVGSTKFALNSVKLLEDPEAAKAVFKYMEANKDVDPRTLSIDYSKIFNAAKMGISEEEFNKKYGETLKTKNTDVLFKELRDSADLSDSAKIATYAKKGKGNVTFKDNDKEAKRIFSELSKGEREFFKAFGKKLGVDFEFFVDSSSATRGEYIPEEGKITINLAKINKVFSIALHEGIGEFLQAHAGDKYNLVATRVIEYYYDKNSLAMTEKVQQYLNIYQNNGQADKSLRAAANEFVNDTLGDIFSTDEGIRDFINWLKSDNETKNVFTKYFKDISNWIKEVRANGQYDRDDVLNFDDALNDAEEIRKMFLESMNEAIANRDQVAAVEATKDDYSAPSLSIDASMEQLNLFYDKVSGQTVIRDRDGNQIKEVTTDMVKMSPLGAVIASSPINDSEKSDQINFVVNMYNMIINTQDIDFIWAVSSTLGFNPIIGDRNGRFVDPTNNLYSALTGNADPQYSSTVDFTTICLKTQAIIDVMSEIMMRENRGLTEKEIVEIVYKETHDAGEPVPCPVCYVFSRWVGLGGLFQNIKTWQEYYDGATWDKLKKEADRLNKEINSKILKTDGKKVAESKAKEQVYKELKKQFNDLNNKKIKKEITPSESRQLKKLTDQIKLLDEWSWVHSVRMDPEYETKGKVPYDVLFNINAGHEFATKYPLAWKFRTTRGPSLGKAATPYMSEHLGQTIRGISGVDLKEIGNLDKNEFLNIVDGNLSKRATLELERARAKAKRQNLLNGQRLQSTSDFRFEYALDYLTVFYELQAIGSYVQLYTKVPESVPMFASVNAEINLSLMPKGIGYEECKATDDGAIKLNNKYYRLIYSNVTGMDADDAFAISKNYDNAQPILVGVSEEHIRLAMRDGNITFIIPYHSSGSSENRYKAMMDAVNESVESRTDFSDFQNDEDLKHPTEKQKLARDLRKKIITGKMKNKNGLVKLTKAEKTLLKSGSTGAEILRQLYIRFYGVNEDGKTEAIDPKYLTEADRSGNRYKDHMTFDVSLTSDPADIIMPYEYWDKTSTIDNAYVNRDAFLEYCEFLGKIPRFNQFKDEDGYWKVLIDRSMYNNDGSYHEQKAINVTNFRSDFLIKEGAINNLKERGIDLQTPSKVNDRSKVKAIADESIKKINARKSLDTDFAPVFYSKMNQEIESIKQDKVGAASVISYLKGKGVKDEEIKWSGIETFLEGKKSVTKQELLNFAKANEFVLEEKTLGLPAADLYYQFEQKLDELGITGFWMDSYIGMDDEFEPDGMLEDLYDLVEEEEVTQEQYDAFEEFYNQKADQYGDSEKTKWDSYTLDGTENYREILFKIPDSKYSNESMKNHWGEAGVLAHARIDDLELPDGSKTLFVEEIQSDWHNAGKKNGYTVKNDSEKINGIIRLKGIINAIKDMPFNFNSLAKKFNYISKETNNELKIEESNDVYYLSDGQSKIITESNLSIFLDQTFFILANTEYESMHNDEIIPDAPYKNTYTDYAMKRLLRMAAEDGYDYIGWTTGKMQEERWSDQYAEGYRIEYDQDIPKFMSKYTKQWNAKVEDIGIFTDNKGYTIQPVKESYVLLDKNYKKIASVKYTDLKDNATAKDAAEYFKNNGYRDVFVGQNYIHAVKITPEMKDSVLYKGQARFSLDPNIGYHAGDLGKSESLGNQSGRDTGHFGTGTYFVGNQKKIEGYNSRDGKLAPVETVDFSKYNLFKPLLNSDGKDLHEFLKGVNNYRFRRKNAIQTVRQLEDIKEYIKDRLWDYDGDDIVDMELLGQFKNLLNSNSIASVFSRYYNSDEYIWQDDEGLANDNDEIKTFEEILKEIPEKEKYRLFEDLYDLIDNWRYESNIEKYENWNNDFYKAAYVLGVDENTLRNIVNQVWEEIDNIPVSANKYIEDSASTRVMKALGYEGIDVRNLDELDNTTYGSVIYDLKDEDLERKNTIGTARFSLEILGDASPYASVYKQVDISKKVMSRVNNAVISGKRLTKKSMDDLKYGLIGKYNLTFDNAFVNELTEDLNEFDAYMRSGKVDYDVIMEYALQIADKIREKSHYFAGGTDLDNDLIIALNIISSYYEQIDAQNKAAKKTEKLDYAEAKKLTEAASELKDNSNEVVKELESDFSQKVAAEEEKINEQIKNGSQKYKGYSKAEINKLANQKVREKLNSQKESEAKAKAKDSVIRTSTRLINWMAHPTDQKHVPEFLKPALTEVIDSIDFVPASLKKDLNAPTDAARTWATSMRRLNDVIAQINSVGSNNADIDDYQVSQMYNLSLVMEADNLFNDMDKFLKEHVGTKNVSNLDAASMKELAKYMASISKAIDRMNSTYANRKYETIDAWGEEAISQMKAMKPVFDKSRFPAADVFHEFLNLEMLEPISFFEEMGEASSSVMDSFFQGEKKGILIIREAEEFFDKLHEDLGLTTSETGKWSDELHEFEVEGVKLTLSTADIMGLLATYKEEEYVKANDPDNATYHIEAGGIVASKKKVGIKTYNYNPTVVHPVYQQLNEMFSKLTDTQKEYVDRVVEYMSTTLASHGNKTSQNMYGYDKFTGKYYYPLKTDKTAIMTNESNSETNQTALRALVNPSFTKTRINRADNALVVMDFFDVVTEHISGMANYCAYAEVVSDTLRWYNYAPTTRIPNGSSWIRDTYGIKNAMRRVKGVKATSYLETFIRDVNLENKVKGNVFQDKLIGMAKAQAVTGNMRVVVQQPCAITRALDVIEQKYLNAGMAQVTKNPVKMTKYAQEKSYLCYWKSKGFSDYRVAQGMKEIIVGNNSKLKDVVEATGMLAGAADDVTWAAMYLASEAKIKATRSDLKVGSSEFDAAVEELFSDIINHTQVIDSTLRKTETNRSKNGLVKLANAFMNEPQKTYNMLHRKINAYYQQGKSEAALKALRKVVAIYCYSAFVTAVAQSVADAFRDDDDETWFYKFLEALLPVEAVNSIKEASEKGTLSVWTFIGCYGQMGNFFDQLNPVNLIPFFAEASNIAKGYKSQRMDTQIFTQIASTMSTLEKGSTPYGTIYSIAQTVSYATGAPFAATLREVKVLYNNTIGALTGKKWYVSKDQKEKVEKSKAAKATEEVFNSNDLAATKAFIQSEYDSKIADGKDESDAWSAVRTTLKEQYLREISEGKDKASLKNKYTTLLKETKVKKNGSYVGLDSDQAYKSYIAKWNESLEEEN